MPGLPAQDLASMMAVDERAVGLAGEPGVGGNTGPWHLRVLTSDQRARFDSDRGVPCGQQEAVVHHSLEVQAPDDRLRHVPDIDVGPELVAPGLDEGIRPEVAMCGLAG
jgi:hypothetical protein